jgi:glycosyltransferase involved in cell wall biosynthesis
VSGRLVLGSVVIPAHNEAGVIARCLDALFEGFEPGELDVVVACNGCVDDTAARARSSGHPIRVLELDEASKPAALRAGDNATQTFPRLYLDADVVLPGSAARHVLERLRDGAIAARSRMPAVLGSLWGAGVCGLSAAGRSRFDAFPDVVGDDLWLDRQFDCGEVEIVDCVAVVVTTPRRTRDLVHVLRRTYRGKGETAAAPVAHDRSRETTRSALEDLSRSAASGPAAALDAATYAAFAAGARLALAVGTACRRSVSERGWERDDSSRAASASS